MTSHRHAVSRRAALAVLASLVAAAGARAAAPAPPTPAQIRAAITTATHSKDLWATINICSARGRRGVIGLRGQMPSLGFTSRLVMIFELSYWSATKHRYLPLPDTRHASVAGVSANAVIQNGVTYKFPPTVTLIGEITFKWFEGTGTLLGATTVRTTAGHPQVASAIPPHYSVSTCTI